VCSSDLNQLLEADFFDLKGTYDLILEQTMFCAIDPQSCMEYAKKTAELRQILSNKTQEEQENFKNFSSMPMRF
jgi:hypothetical protein